MGELEGRAALVTGGASGIGAATARLFAEHGAIVGVIDRAGPRGPHTFDVDVRDGDAVTPPSTSSPMPPGGSTCSSTMRGPVTSDRCTPSTTSCGTASST